MLHADGDPKRPGRSPLCASILNFSKGKVFSAKLSLASLAPAATFPVLVFGTLLSPSRAGRSIGS